MRWLGETEPETFRQRETHGYALHLTFLMLCACAIPRARTQSEIMLN
jgi:hypothetical protein